MASDAAALPPDPYTWSTRLCDDNGMVSDEVAFRGPNLTLTYLDILHNLRMQNRPGCDRITEPFHCTGHAHLAGEHILCTSPKHKIGQTMWSENPGVYVEPDGTVITAKGTAACVEPGCDPTVTGDNCVGCPSLGVPVEITLTADQRAYVEKLIAATTDTGAEPLTVEQYVQGIVDRTLAKHEQAQTGQSYG